MNPDEDSDLVTLSKSSSWSSRQKLPRPHASKIKFTNTVDVRTSEEGYNSGRAYCIRSDSGRECHKIAEDLRAYSQAARRRFELRTPLERMQERLKAVYDSSPVQAFVGFLIISVRLPWRGNNLASALRKASLLLVTDMMDRRRILTRITRAFRRAELHVQHYRLAAHGPADRRRRQPHAGGDAAGCT